MPYDDDEKFRELVDMLIIAVAGQQFPDFDFVREAVDLAEELVEATTGDGSV